MRPIGEAEFVVWSQAIAAAFGEQLDEAELARWRKITELDRTLAVVDDGDVVATAGAFSFELTLPGATTLPVAGVTAVSVRPTHRRQGLLTRMMAHQLDDIAGRGEAVAVLGASESAIYGRYGYGQAASYQAWELATAGTTFARPPDTGGRIRVIDSAEAAEVLPAVYDRCRLRHPGMVSLPPAFWEVFLDDPASERDGASPLFFAAHVGADGVPDGIVAYRRKGGHSDTGLPAGQIVMGPDLYSVSDEVDAALWAFLVDTDLVRTIRTHGRPVDEPLRWRLADPRRVETKVVSDSLWLRVLDPAVALSARRYATDDRLVVELTDPFRPANDGRWAVEGGADGATATPTSDPADLALAAPELGAVYLGGVRPSVLARAGLVEERRRGALARADAFFSASPAPWCATDF